MQTLEKGLVSHCLKKKKKKLLCVNPLLIKPLHQFTNGTVLQAKESTHSSQEQLSGSLAEG